MVIAVPASFFFCCGGGCLTRVLSFFLSLSSLPHHSYKDKHEVRLFGRGNLAGIDVTLQKKVRLSVCPSVRRG